MWVSRDHLDQQEALDATGSFVSAAWLFVLIFGPDQSESAGALASSSPTFANGDVNIQTEAPPESAAAVAGSPSFDWLFVIVQGPDQSESAAAVASSSPTFANEQVWIFGVDQSESASALAATPTFANG